MPLELWCNIFDETQAEIEGHFTSIHAVHQYLDNKHLGFDPHCRGDLEEYREKKGLEHESLDNIKQQLLADIMELHDQVHTAYQKDLDFSWDDVDYHIYGQEQETHEDKKDSDLDT